MTPRTVHCLLTVVLAAGGGLPGRVRACPFCTAASQTLGEELAAADVAVIASPLDTGAGHEPDRTGSEEETVKARFRIVDVLRGDAALQGRGEIEVLFYGNRDPETEFLITGLSAPKLDFATPLPLSPAARAYIRRLAHLPDRGADRLDFFQDFLEHEDPMLAQDAYDEFARAPYEDLIGLEDRMRHEQLIGWIRDLDIPVTRRRLYLTMLGVCGGPSDLPMLDAMIRSDDRRAKMGLDAMIGSYLTIRGADGMPLIEERFLKDSSVPYQDTYAAVTALRFHGQQASVIPRARVVEAMRLLLDHPDLADQVIADLARWEDWSVLDRLVDLFEKAEPESRWVRIPVVNYLRVCGKQDNEVGRKALSELDRLAKIDPESIKRADVFFAFGGLGGVRARDEKATDEAIGTDAQAPEGDDAAGAPESDVAEPDADDPPRRSGTQPQAGSPSATESVDGRALPAESDAHPTPRVVVGPEADAFETAEAAPPSRLRIVGVAVIVGGLLIVVLGWILHGPGERAT